MTIVLKKNVETLLKDLMGRDLNLLRQKLPARRRWKGSVPSDKPGCQEGDATIAVTKLITLPPAYGEWTHETRLNWQLWGGNEANASSVMWVAVRRHLWSHMIHVEPAAVQTFPLWCDWKCCAALCAALVRNVMNRSLSSSRLNHFWLIPWLPMRLWAMRDKPRRVLHIQHTSTTLTAMLLWLLFSVFTSGVFL